MLSLQAALKKWNTLLYITAITHLLRFPIVSRQLVVYDVDRSLVSIQNNETMYDDEDYSMHNLLSEMANEDGFVLVTAVNYAYRSHLMNFKCTLERVGQNRFVVAAMDEQIYQWGVKQGLPIFLANNGRGKKTNAGGNLTSWRRRDDDTPDELSEKGYN